MSRCMRADLGLFLMAVDSRTRFSLEERGSVLLSKASTTLIPGLEAHGLIPQLARTTFLSDLELFSTNPISSNRSGPCDMSHSTHDSQ